MNYQNEILFIGEDDRQKALYDLMLKKGYRCKFIFGKSDTLSIKKMIENADVIILPLPVTKDGINVFSNNDHSLSISDLLAFLSPKTSVIGGMINNEIQEKLEEKNMSFFDYYEDETFVKYNAHLTAQGAVRLLLENSDDYIVSKKILVAGSGRISKALLYFLRGLGIDIYIAARSKADRNEAELFGAKAIDTKDIEKSIHIFDHIINTVPSGIFSSEAVSHIKDSGLYIELASKPFGANKADFECFGKKYILASQLPGRFYPKQSASAILKSIKDLL